MFAKVVHLLLNKIGKIRQFLTTEATKQLVHALVISRMYFDNSLLYGLPDIKFKSIKYESKIQQFDLFQESNAGNT